MSPLFKNKISVVIPHKPRCVHFMSHVRKYGCQEGGSSRPGSFYAPCSAGNGGKNFSRHEDRGMRRLAPFLPGCGAAFLVAVRQGRPTARCWVLTESKALFAVPSFKLFRPPPSSMKNISLPRFRSADRRWQLLFESYSIELLVVLSPTSPATFFICGVLQFSQTCEGGVECCETLFF